MTSKQSKILEAKDAIKKKLRGKPLTYKEIYNIMDEIAKDRLGDILTTYFAAASFTEGFSEDELYYMTKAMVETGKRLEFEGIIADKHSIGGLAGARTTMIIVPIIAACGFKIPKTSSRAITSPAGTADSMETLAKVDFKMEQVKKIVNDIGGCIIWGGHLGIAPADDEIIQVEAPLSFESFDKIIVSVMAKKIAAGTNHLVIDIPLGETMKVKYKKDAEIVKRKFTEIAKRFGIKIKVEVFNTLDPEGNGIGPQLEAIDALKVLEQDESRPIPLEERSLKLAGALLDLCYKTQGAEKNGYEEAKKVLKDGLALKKFKEIIKAQHGNEDISSNKLKPAEYSHEMTMSKSGKIKAVNNLNLNALAKILGAPKDKKAGMFLYKKTGDKFNENEVLFTLYSSSQHRLQEALDTLKNFPIFEI